MKEELELKYRFAKTIVLDEGFQDEILWQSRLCLDDLTESTFLREIAWVILTCGMKESIIRNRFGAISNCFFDWSDAKIIIKNREKCTTDALKIFNNSAKISAILNSALVIEKIGFDKLKQKIKVNPIETLRQFEFIGPVTVYHLAKNIGLPVAKPDRHLLRIAQMEKYQDVQTFCTDLSNISGDSISVVDIVLWRFATIEHDYLKVLSSLNCSNDLENSNDDSRDTHIMNRNSQSSNKNIEFMHI
jgi:hypothetical protein